jgi:hypothetical protein
MKEKARPIATLDIETDPFLYNRTPCPFAIGFYDGSDYVDFWGDDCVIRMMQYLADREPLTIYVHNGGGFDFWYMQDFITNPLFFIHSRIAKCGLMDKHELRDSYKMIPVPLGDYQKDEIDYATFEYPEREKKHNKEKILRYLYGDCVYLFNLVTDFIERHGQHLTMPSAAMSALNKIHPQKHESKYYDALFRPYYYGGRNQCFESGEIKIPFKIYDVNSMYPYVMKSYSHPLGCEYRITRKLNEDKVSFVKLRANSRGALPVATKDGLKFPVGVNDFVACSHEIIMAQKLGMLDIIKIYEMREFQQTQSFDKFVDKYSAMKIEAEQNGDKGGRLFAKLFLNTGYGKFGQNPEKFKDCMLFNSMDELKEAGYRCEFIYGSKLIGSRPSEIKPWSYNNVAIAASITSAARAELLNGIAHSVRPLYCDTDSIICESLDADLDASRLGAWKCEGEGDTIYIAGKKMYACYKDGEPLLVGKKEKKASKGVNMSASTIRAVAMGESVQMPIDPPVLKFFQDAKFISRNIRATA